MTFDGRHILDGELVSARPEIVIRLRDESRYLALSDTSHLDLAVRHPSGALQSVYYTDANVQFFPADTSNLQEKNVAEIQFNPEFWEDGIYELMVHGEDASGNDAGDIDYRISFEVINQAMISNGLNYPNPFSTSTRFVFTLTGSEIPSYFKIQIMTVTGKIVREITHHELGPMHIGVNISDFAWDGTDEFGDPLGNGVYFYRVVARLPGEALEHYSTSIDKYFKSGWGKMWLGR